MTEEAARRYRTELKGYLAACESHDLHAAHEHLIALRTLDPPTAETVGWHDRTDHAVV